MEEFGNLISEETCEAEEETIAGETKEEKFRRIAAPRVSRIVKDLRMIGKMSNPQNYQYSDEQIEKMFAVIEQELYFAKTQFDCSKKRKGMSFSFLFKEK